MVNDRCDDINNFAINQAGGTVTNQDGTLDGHTDYLQLFDNNASAGVWATQTFVSSQNYGTVYLYVRTTDVTKESDCNLITYNIGCWIRIFSSKMQAFYSSSWHDIIDPLSNNTWYKCKFEFEITTGGYKGLPQNKWNFWVDDVKLVNAQNIINVGAFTYIKVHTVSADSDYYFFSDELYYSWDGWSHDFIGIENTNIDKINGVNKTDISKVIGV